MTKDKTALARPHRYYGLIPAAGAGLRMNALIPKQYLPLAGKLVLQHVIDVFSACREMEHLYVVLNPNDAWIDEYIANGKIQFDESRVTLLDCGGATRRESVLAGLEMISPRISEMDWVLVHDAARPGLTPELLGKLITGVGDDPVGGILALSVVDTVKRRENSGVKTISREGLWLAQTPQMFRYAMLCKALKKYPEVTDEAGAIEALGLVPRLIEGHLRNSKITRSEDMHLVELFLK
jgi:2-C-methyl-D-erythritol 4-phosphate cytidylyltransferase